MGPDAAELLEYICVAKVGGDTPVGKGVYTHFLDAKQAEWDAYRTHVSDWELQRYLEQY